RRHTRCLSDWSSDVCSSDLLIAVPGLVERAANVRGELNSAEVNALQQHLGKRIEVVEQDGAGIHLHAVVKSLRRIGVNESLDRRSEERRVGKECRSLRWGA